MFNPLPQSASAIRLTAVINILLITFGCSDFRVQSKPLAGCSAGLGTSDAGRNCCLDLAGAVIINHDVNPLYPI